ncbi:ABC transporter permease [Pallidibacillus thermolactis]|jgi:peptide/nickel transport system permease protein|uniref:ABC transporter permease n=1 Tax=Pallidibacillus thermolactis TaxID=251051 RepID=UPI00156AE631|nr:ABC transporter permease [Pallidibacillus thermolactis]MCU9601096.1 ABC transporter permease [Pallidibacillus thermolactis subsp. kokeshiiformis]MED1672735.1 ABC transporter permease [Pallidibacillus thermolactis subsp. kokeshiiformis]
MATPVVNNTNTDLEKVKSPSGFKIIVREFLKDKVALISLILFVGIVLYVYIYSLGLDTREVTRVDIFNQFREPGAEHWLGTDYGGRDVFNQLILGARNSLTIGIAITLITSIIGIALGLLAGYYGGWVDNVIMRTVDFVLVLPALMIIIVYVSIVPEFNVLKFIFIMSLFYWTSKCRLVRSKALAERELEYVAASKTLGTPDWKIMLFNVLPNLSSIIIVNMTLNLAGNIGIETSLTYLGFGLPENVPSLGTLISYSRNPEVMENKPWVWLPAAILILVLMLCINFIGNALKRAADARQRLG